MLVRMGGKFVFCSYRWVHQYWPSLILKEFRDGADTTVSVSVPSIYNSVSKEVSMLSICTSLSLVFCCICLRFKFEWHMVHIVEAMYIWSTL